MDTEHAPSTKIWVILILCIAGIASVWILNKKPGTGNLLAQKKDTLISDTTVPDSENAWRNALLANSKYSTSTFENVSGSNSSTGDTTDNTLTAQLSKDFFSQYLVLKKSNGTVSAEEAVQIAKNTISDTAYTKATGKLYSTLDIHVNTQTSKEIVQTYAKAINASLKKNSPKKLENELVILDRAVKSGKESDLAQLDPIINGYKGLIRDLTSMSVPQDGVTVHLGFLNSVSNVLANIEAMRVTFSDPVRSFAGVSQYKQHALELAFAMQKLDLYFQANR